MTDGPAARSRARAGTALLTALLLAAGCQRRTPPPQPAPAPHAVVGAPWLGAGGVWFYPRAQTDYHGTGLAVVETAHPARLTTDGELYDPGLPAAAHQTLQLPAVIRVTDLENGRSLLLRLNDRGPVEPDRVLALTPKAASLLGMRPGMPARVAIDLDVARSQAIGGGTGLDIVAAPVEGVQEQPLGAPGAAAGPAPGPSPDPSPAGRESLVDQRLPADAEQGIAQPGALWIDAGRFSRQLYADQVAAGIGGVVRSDGQGRETVYLVRLGPFQRVSDADAALDQARRTGVTGAHIIVE